jgi:hypothetical protein
VGPHARTTRRRQLNSNGATKSTPPSNKAHDDRMSARSLVLEAGDRVTGWGRLVADADGVWLDLARVIPLMWSDRRSNRSVRLTGADLRAVPTQFEPDTVPGAVTITGIWLGDTIEVKSQSPAGPFHAAPPPGSSREWITPPCPPPSGGWPRGKPNQSLDFDLGDLQTSGAAVTVVTYRPSPEQAVLVVAASDIDAVQTALRPQLPDRLCVVPSRWTQAQLDEVRARFDHHHEDWALDTWGKTIDEHAQPFIEVHLLRVTAELADWADTLPDGLLKLVPALTPVPAELPMP